MRNAKRRDGDVGDMELVRNGGVGGEAEIRREKRNVDEETEETEHKRRRKRRLRHRHIPKLNKKPKTQYYIVLLFFFFTFISDELEAQKTG